MNLNAQIVAALRGQRERIAGGIISETIADPGELRGQVAKKLFGKAPVCFYVKLFMRTIPQRLGTGGARRRSGIHAECLGPGHKHSEKYDTIGVILFHDKV